jgi:galactokinase
MSSTTINRNSRTGQQYQVFVPGRVCLFGEHSDWAGGDEKKLNSNIAPGRTIVVGTNQGLHASVSHHPTSFIVTSRDETGKVHGPFSVPMTSSALLDGARDGNLFFRYACGVAYHMLINYRVTGLSVDNYLTDLPLGKGLSSSAAFCVLIARAFSRVYNLKLTTRGEMDCAYVGERLTPSKVYNALFFIFYFFGKFECLQFCFLNYFPLNYLLHLIINSVVEWIKHVPLVVVRY